MNEESRDARYGSHIPAFLSGGGEMGALMRSHDWSASPLGHPETWPPALRTAVSLMINSRHPMFIAWGPDLAFLYNDGYAPIFGAKHPHMLGLPFREAWPEIWDDIWPLIERALSGEPTWSENLHLVMHRNGFPEDTWYSFSYSPIRDESGSIGGMFCACQETTGQVLGERRQTFLLALGDSLRSLRDAGEVKAAASQMLGRHLGVARAGYGEIDETGEVIRVERDWSEGVTSLAGEARLLEGFGEAVAAELRAGRTLRVDDCATDPRAVGTGVAETWASIDLRSIIAVPLVKEGRFVAFLYLHEPHPRVWTDEEVTLAQDVAERTWAAVERARTEARLRESEERLQLALSAGVSIGTWDWDVTTDRVTADERFARLYGVDPEKAAAGAPITEFFGNVHPDDLPGLREAIDTALRTGEPFAAEYRLVQADGSVRWAAAEGRCTLAPDGSPLRFPGATFDITDRKEAEERQALLIGELHHRVKNILATVQSIIAFTLRTSPDMKTFQEGVSNRIGSLGRSHALLTNANWNGAGLRDMLGMELEPYGSEHRLRLHGPDIKIPADAAVATGMAIHELTTNAVKYGSLSVPGGRLSVTWSVEPHGEDRRLRIEWIESGGPPVSPPTRKGFGSSLLQRLLVHQLEGTVDMDFRPEGLQVHITVIIGDVEADSRPAPAPFV